MARISAWKVLATALNYKARILFGIVLLLASAPVSVRAQTTDPASRPDRGVGPNGGYLSSGLDNINLTNGNVSVSLPLASLPPAIGGRLSWTLSAIYNSKLWNLKMIENPPDAFHETKYATQRVQRGDTGGWLISGKYELSQQFADDDVQTECSGGDQACVAALAYRYKMILITPDGSRHELRPLDPSAQEYTGVGNQNYREGYYNATPTTAGHAMKYYSFDGSYIWAIIHLPTDNVTWEVYMQDGTHVTQRAGGRQIIADPNGNKIEIRTETDATGIITTRFVDAQTAREIRYIYDPAGEGTGSVQYQVAGGGWQTITLNFGRRTLQGRVANLCDRACTTVGDANHPQLTVITSITLPVTETGVLRKYEFHYNCEDIVNNITPEVQYRASCSSSLQSVTSASRGWGALSQIMLPTGATIEYDYSLDNDWYAANEPIIGAREVPREVIKEKRLKYEGQTDTWQYTINSTNSTVIGPDGSVTGLDFFDHDPRHGGYMGGTTGFSGLIYRTNLSGKMKIEKQWEMREFNDASHDTPEGRVGFNTVVKAEYTTMFGSAGVPDRMSAKVFDYDFNGNVTSTAEYDWFDPTQVVRDGNNVPTGVPANLFPMRVTTNTYYSPATNASSSNIYANRNLATATPLILNALQEAAIGPRRAQYFYDFQALSVPPVTGNLTQTSRFKSGSTWVNTTYTYDSRGNCLSATDPDLNRTDYVIDPNTLAQPTSVTVYPDRSNMTKKLTTTIDYDFSTGLEIRRTDASGAETQISYINQLTNAPDPFDRPGKVTGPLVTVRVGGSTSTQQRTVVTRYYDNARQVETLSDLNNTGDGLLKTRTTLDRIGRLTKTEISEDGTSYTISSESVYVYKPDGVGGFAVFTSNAHRAAGALTDGWARTTHDRLGRVTEVATFAGASQPPNTGGSYNGRTVTVYDGFQTTVTDQGLKVRRSVVDGLGRLTQVTEDPSGLNYSTAYGYDDQDNLTQVTQGPANQQQQRVFIYDNLSRMTNARNPEQINSTGASGQMADTVYEYDDASNLKKRTNPNGSWVMFDYDGLNRVKSKTLSTGDSYTYAYDSAGVLNGQGRLASVTKAGGDGCYYDAYDAAGRVTASRQVTGGTPYGLEYGYNLAGDMTWEKYPSGREITTTYDSAGRMNAVNGAKTGEGNRLYASQYLYTAPGAARSVTLGNTVVVQVDYNDRGQVTKIEARKAGVLHLGLDYTYGSSASTNNGNVAAHTIRIGTSINFGQSFIYDGINRLTTAQEGSPIAWRQGFDYDRFGNRTFNAATTGNVLGENIALNASSNRISTAGYSYDFSGNLTNAPGKLSVYDAENRQVHFTDTNTGIVYDYTYDGDGRRVKMGVNGVTTVVMVYNASGQMVAEYTSGPAQGSGTKYLTADALGSTRLVTDGDGNVKARHDYLPFGEEMFTVNGRGNITGYNTNDLTRQRFTGKEHDNESGLDYFLARYYSSSQSRFTSVDPENAGSNYEDSQSWNGYAYARGNPLLYIDPDGREYIVWSEYGVGYMSDEEFYRERDHFYSAFETRLTFTGDHDWYEQGDIIAEGKVVAHYAQISIDSRAQELAYEMRQNFRDSGVWKRAAARGILFGVLSHFGQIRSALRRTPAPALKGDPYHPDSMRSRVRPPYETNPAHDPKSPHYNPRKTPEPPDASNVYNSSVRTGMGTWYGKSANGEYYRFFSDNAGHVHFSGTVPKSSVPKEALRQLE